MTRPPVVPPPVPDRLTPHVRATGSLQLTLGTVGVVGAGLLLAPKLAALAAGISLAGVSLAANLALLGGSLMLLREGRRAWRRVRAARPPAPRADRAAV